jgi:cell division protease FtsH
VAEELVLKEFTTGAGNDIERATDLARKMVCEWGMSETMGPVTFGKREEHVFLGRDLGQVKDYSEDTAVKIDEEVRRIVNDAHTRAKTTIQENIGCLHGIAQALLEKESLDSAAIDEIMRGGCRPDSLAEAS